MRLVSRQMMEPLILERRPPSKICVSRINPSFSRQTDPVGAAVGRRVWAVAEGGLARGAIRVIQRPVLHCHWRTDTSVCRTDSAGCWPTDPFPKASPSSPEPPQPRHGGDHRVHDQARQRDAAGHPRHPRRGQAAHSDPARTSTWSTTRSGPRSRSSRSCILMLTGHPTTQTESNHGRVHPLPAQY